MANFRFFRAFTLCSFSRHGITQASLVLLIWLTKMFRGLLKHTVRMENFRLFREFCVRYKPTTRNEIRVIRFLCSNPNKMTKKLSFMLKFCSSG